MQNMNIQNPWEHEKIYYCRHCNKSERSMGFPDGWYMLSRSLANLPQKKQNLGLYCCARCLGESIERIAVQQEGAR